MFNCPKPRKVVLALSTQHTGPMVDGKTSKPEIILYYNSAKGGVDVVDSMLETAMGKPTLRRWPTAVFFMMLGVAQVNSFTVLLLNRGSAGGDYRRGMRLALGQELAKQSLQERLTNPIGLNSDTLAALASVTGQEAARQQLQPSGRRADDAPPACGGSVVGAAPATVRPRRSCQSTHHAASGTTLSANGIARKCDCVTRVPTEMSKNDRISGDVLRDFNVAPRY